MGTVILGHGHQEVLRTKFMVYGSHTDVLSGSEGEESGAAQSLLLVVRQTWIGIPAMTLYGSMTLGK